MVSNRNPSILATAVEALEDGQRLPAGLLQITAVIDDNGGQPALLLDGHLGVDAGHGRRGIDFVPTDEPLDLQRFRYIDQDHFSQRDFRTRFEEQRDVEDDNRIGGRFRGVSDLGLDLLVDMGMHNGIQARFLGRGVENDIPQVLAINGAIGE
ncbi:hypothetical protein DESC_100074 [Desulfosarcina cetonica]|nr:hypothetical protein DESC_100074 [Desulfosarcina cetonica]